MAAAVSQTLDPDQPSLLPPSTSEASSSRLAATVTDESEELAAEAGVVKAEPSTTNGEANGDVEMNGETKVEADGKEKEKEEEEEDPNRIPDNACETLYLQNLNEKVRIPGQLTMCLLS